MITEDASTLGRRDSAISSVRYHDRPAQVTANERKSEKSVHSARSPRRHHKDNASRKNSPLYIAPLIDCRWQVFVQVLYFTCGLNRIGLIGNQIRLTSCGNLRYKEYQLSLFVMWSCKGILYAIGDVNASEMPNGTSHAVRVPSFVSVRCSSYFTFTIRVSIRTILIPFPRLIILCMHEKSKAACLCSRDFAGMAKRNRRKQYLSSVGVNAF